MINVSEILKNAYVGRMSVFSYRKVREKNIATIHKTLIFDNIPCLLTSMVSNRSSAKDIKKNDKINEFSSAKKIFLSNEFNVKTGSYVEVLQDGQLYTFEYSGESFRYKTHQEIIVETYKIA